MCMNPQGQAIYTQLGRRDEEGFTPDRRLGVGEKWKDRHPEYVAPQAKDIPLGDGLSHAAKFSLLNRREKIRQAVEGT